MIFHTLFYTTTDQFESMISLKVGGFIVAAFMAGAFLASPELRAYAANTVGSADIINESILSADIKNGEVKTDDIAPSAVGSLRIKDNDVKAQDIAADAVGASELQGVSKLIFGTCSLTFPDNSGISGASCPITGARPGDRVVATVESTFQCGNTPLLHSAYVISNDVVHLYLDMNTGCPIPDTMIVVNVILFR
jgi:hypothetical protein